jgi:hypothetical protein
MTIYQGVVAIISATTNLVSRGGKTSFGSVAISAQSSPTLQEGAREYDINSVGDDYLEAGIITWTAYSGITGGHPVYYNDTSLFSSLSITANADKVKFSTTPLGSAATVAAAATRIVAIPIEAHYFGRPFFGPRYFPVYYGLTTPVSPTYDTDTNVNSATFVDALGGIITHGVVQVIDLSYLSASAVRTAKTTNRLITGQSSVDTAPVLTATGSALLNSISALITNARQRAVNSVVVQALSTTALTPEFFALGQSDIGTSSDVASTAALIQYPDTAMQSDSSLTVSGGRRQWTTSSVLPYSNIGAQGLATRQAQLSALLAVASLAAAALRTAPAAGFITSASLLTTSEHMIARSQTTLPGLTSVSSLAYLVARTLVPINTLSTVAAVAKRFAALGAAITDTAVLTASATAARVGLLEEFLAASSVVSQATGYRPAVSNPVFVTSSLTALVRFIGHGISDLASLSNVASVGARTRPGATAVNVPSVLSAAASILRPGFLDTLIAASVISAQAAGVKPATVPTALVTSSVTSLVRFIGDATTSPAALSSLAVQVKRYRSAQSGLQSSSSLDALATGVRPSSILPLDASSSVVADGILSALWGTRLITGTAIVSVTAYRIATASPHLASTSAVMSDATGFRPALSAVATLSSLNTVGRGFRPATSNAISGNSYITFLGTGYRPGGTLAFDAFTELQSTAVRRARARLDIASLSDILLQGHALRPAESILDTTSFLQATAAGFRPALSNLITATSYTSALGVGYRPGALQPFEAASTLEAIPRRTAYTPVSLQSSTNLASIGARFRYGTSTMQDSATIHAAASSTDSGVPTPVLALSALASLAIGHRPATSQNVWVASNISSLAKFIGKTIVPIGVLSDVISAANRTRFGNSAIYDTTTLNALARAYKPGFLSTLEAVSTLMAFDIRIRPGAVDQILSSSETLSAADLIARGYTDLVSHSLLALNPRLYRRSSTTAQSTAFITAADRATFLGSPDTVASASAVLVDAASSKPRFSDVILGTSFLSSPAIFIGAAYTSINVASTIAALDHRYRPATTALISDSTLVANGHGYKPGLANTIAGISFIDSLAKALKPGQANPLLVTSRVGTFETLVAAAHTAASSTSVLGVNPVGFRPAAGALASTTMLISNATGWKPDSTSLQSSSSLASLGKAKKPGQIAPVTVASSAAAFARFIGSGRLAVASASVLLTLAQRIRVAASVLISLSLLTTLARATKSGTISIQDSSVITAPGRGRFRDRPPPLLAASAILASARVRFSGRNTLASLSAVATQANRIPSIRWSLLATTSVVSTATGLKPDSSDIQNYSVLTALGRGKRPGELFSLFPASTLSASPKLTRRATTNPASITLLGASAERSRTAHSDIGSVSSVFVALAAMKPAFSSLHSNSVLTALAKAHKPGQLAAFLPSSNIAVAVRLIPRSTAHPVTLSSLTALANRIRYTGTAIAAPSSLVSLGRGYRPASSQTLISTSSLDLRYKYTARMRTTLNVTTSLSGSGKRIQRATPNLPSLSFVSTIGRRIARQTAYPYSISALTTTGSRITPGASDVVSRTSGIARASRIARTAVPIDSYTDMTAIPIYGSAGSGHALFGGTSALNVNTAARYIDRSHLASLSTVDATLRALRRARSPMTSQTELVTSAARIAQPLVSLQPRSAVIPMALRSRSVGTNPASLSIVLSNPHGHYRSRVALGSAALLDVSGRRVRYGIGDLIRSTSRTESIPRARFVPNSSIIVGSSIIARATVKRQARVDVASNSITSSQQKAIFRDRLTIAAASATTEQPISKFKNVQNLISYSFITSNAISGFIDSASVNATTRFLNLRGSHTAIVNSGILSASDIRPRGSLIPGGIGVILDTNSIVFAGGKGRFRDKPAIASSSELSALGTRQQHSTLALQPSSVVNTNGTRQARGAAALASASVLEANQKAFKRSNLTIAQPSHVRVMFYHVTKPGFTGIASTASLNISYKVNRRALSSVLPYSVVVSTAGKKTLSTGIVSSRSQLASLSNRIGSAISAVDVSSQLISRARARYRPGAAVLSTSLVQSDAYRAKYITASVASTSHVMTAATLTARAAAPITAASVLDSATIAQFSASCNLDGISNIRVRRLLRVRQARSLIESNSNLIIVGRMTPPIDSASLLIGV